MPTVETQTTWSWVQDLSALAKLTDEHRELELSIGRQDIRELDLTTGKVSASHEQEFDINTVQENSDQLFRSFGFMPVHRVTSEDPIQHSPQSDSSSNTEPQQTKELHLPIISLTRNQEDKCIQKQKTNDVTLPPVVPNAQYSNDLSDPDTPDEEEIEQAYTDLSLPNLPWPKILQYMRESESYAAKYFSLQNKRTLAKRLKEAKATHKTGLSMNNTSNKKLELQGGTGVSTDDDTSEESELDASDVEGEDIQRFPDEQLETCDFCGEPKPKYNILDVKESAQKDEEDKEFCCEEYKAFCVLVATCLRQLVDKLQHSPPKKISIKLTKQQIQKTAEQRAFALMCRKRKWEQLLQKRTQQKTTIGKTLKQTRIIQFSLLSTEILDTGWMVRPQSKTKHCTARKKKVQQKLDRKKRANVLTLGILKRLRNDKPNDGELDQRLYGDGTSFVTLLPNRTGQCNYRSGNIAVAAFSPYAGVLAYLLYEDSTKVLLGYLDELGRISCYYSDGKLQLYSGQTGGMVFDHDGTIRRRWEWDSPNGSSFQPTTTTLNKYLTVKCQSRGHSTITFSSEHKVIKISVDCQLQKDETLRSVVDLTYSNWLADQLQQSKKQISGILLCLQSTNRSRKLAQLKSVYNPLGREKPQHSTRQRTKSTGAIPINTKQSTLKHTHRIV
ncbi:uncharacterized protein LOC135342250 [Halichondria panicea]|uniref:uncharacterized protein LOC135342250 n=1 Tax=Halichondria panicea TaxID=6063 RepID=UPI00312B8C3A